MFCLIKSNSLQDLLSFKVILKIHKQMAHASEEALRKCLSIAGADRKELGLIPKAINGCDCLRWKPKPRSSPVVSMPVPYRLGEAIMADIAYMHEGFKKPMIHVIEMSTSMSMGAFLPGKTAKLVINAVVKLCMNRWGGLPVKIYIDPGGELANMDLEEVAAQWDIDVESSSPHAHWQRGKVERHHQMVRSSYLGAKQECTKIPDDIVLTMAIDGAKNHISNVRGLSPWQLCNGANARLPNLLNANVPLLTRTDSDLRQSEDFAFLYCLAKAREAYIRAEMDQALRTAISRNVRTSGYTNVTLGEMVYFWNAGKYHKNKPNFYRGKVVGLASGKVLIMMGGRIHDVPPNWIIDPKQYKELNVCEAKATLTLEDACDNVHVNFEFSETDELTPPPENIKWDTARDGPLTKNNLNDTLDLVDLRASNQEQMVEEDSEPSPLPKRNEIVDNQSEDDVKITGMTNSNLNSNRNENTKKLDSIPEEEEYVHIPIPASHTKGIYQAPPGTRGNTSAGNNKVNKELKKLDANNVPDLNSGTMTRRQKRSALYTQKLALYGNRSLSMSDQDIFAYILQNPDLDNIYVKPPQEVKLQNDLCWKVDPVALYFEQKKNRQQCFLSKKDLLKAKEIPLEEAMKDERFTWEKGAIQREIDSWLENGVAKVAPIDPSKKLLNSRWVFTEKSPEDGVDPIGKGLKAKARIVIKGFMDPDKANLATDSPTMRRELLRVLSFISAQNGWRPGKIDIKTAFLNAKLPREVQVRPPPGIDLPKDHCWQLVKAAYGLADAPREWYLEFMRFLQTLPLQQSRYDPCVWYYYKFERSKRGSTIKTLAGLIGTHVDDCFFAGESEFKKNVIDKIREKFKIGLELYDDFTFCGIHVKWDDKEKSISLDQDEYINSIKDIDIPDERWKQEDSPCTPNELTIFRGKLGELMWVSGQTRPELSVYTSILSTKTGNLKVSDLAMCQYALQEARDKRLKLTYKNLGLKAKDGELDHLALYAFFDASFGDIPQAGCVVFIGHKENQEGTSNVCLLDWKSHKQYRVVHSTFAAETLSGAEAMDTVRYLQLIIVEAYGWPDHKQDEWPMYTSLITDCDSLWSNTRSLTTSIKERALLRELAIFREALTQGVIEEFRWTPTNIQLADALTKIMDGSTLTNAISEGIIRLKPNSSELASKKGSMKLRFIHKLPPEMICRKRQRALFGNILKCFLAHSLIKI